MKMNLPEWPLPRPPPLRRLKKTQQRSPLLLVLLLLLRQEDSPQYPARAPRRRLLEKG